MVRRKLTDEEIELWQRVADRAERLHSNVNPSRPLPKPKPTRLPAPQSSPPVRPPSPAATPGPTLTTRTPSVQMDKKAFVRMKRGKLVPEGRIDLHGMTLDRAHTVLTRFILSSQASGRRLVLVITGKGKASKDNGPIPVPHGILRRNVPLWLAMPPLAQAVLQVETAHIRHGGGGALYVYLKRSR